MTPADAPPLRVRTGPSLAAVPAVTGVDSPPAAPGWCGAPLVVAASALAGAVLLGGVVAYDPEALHFSAALDATGIGMLLGAIVACVLALRAPALGLYLLTVFVYLNISQALVRHHDVPSVLQVLVVPIFLAGWADARARPGRAGAWPRWLTALLATYTGLLLLSTTWSRDVALADTRTLEVLKAGVLFAAIVLLAATPARVRGAVVAAVAAGTILAGLGVLQHVTGDFSTDYGGLARIKLAHIHGEVFEPRIAGPLGDPNFFAQILLVLVPLALALAWNARLAATRVLSYSAVLVLIAGIVLTYSRGGALALALVLLLSLATRGLGVRRLLAGIALLAVLVLSLPDDFTRRLTTLGQILPGSDAVLNPDSSFGKRRVVTAVAWRMFLDRPLLGVGAGNYPARFDEYVEEVGSVAREYEADGSNYPHSLYLELLAETGLLGFTTFGLVLAACFAGLSRARSALQAAGRGAGVRLARAVEIALVGYLVSSVFLHGHHLRYLWLLIALAAALSRVAQAELARAESGEGSACATS